MNDRHLKGTKLYEHEKFLSGYAGADRVVRSTELAELLGKMPKPATINTGFESFDRLTGGVEAGELVVVTGPTGDGKTTFLMSITRNLVAAAQEALWFTLEVTPRQFLEKIQLGAPTMPVFYIPANPIDEADEDYVKRWEGEHRRRYDMLDWIEDRIIEAKVKYETADKKLSAVFIDHIHSLFSIHQFSGNVSLELADLVEKVKQMALHYDLAIFLIAHCKDVPSDSNREIRMSDIRDSGMIIRTADIVAGVWRIPNTEDGHKAKNFEIGEDDIKSKIRVWKNRRLGKKGYFVAYHKDHHLAENTF